MDIDRSIKQPVFRQIYNILRAEIEAGKYAETGMLPGEMELCGRFLVERNTVRKALQIFVDDGRIVRTRGFGTKIVEHNAIPMPDIVPDAGPFANRCIMLAAQEDYMSQSEGESFHFKLIRAIEKRLSDFGCNLIFKSIGKSGPLTDALRSASPAAIIFDSYNSSAYYQEVVRSGIPCVSVNHDTPFMTSIVSNNFGGAGQAAQMLADAGHSKIALILGKRSHQTCQERLSGVQSFFMARGMPLHEKYLLPGNWLFGSGADAADRIAAMKDSDRPTAVFAFNDDMAYGCYNRLLRHGLSVPGDISIIGFDNSDRYAAMFPPISTVDVNIDAIVDYAIWAVGGILSGSAPKTRAKIQIDAALCDNGTVRAL